MPNPHKKLGHPQSRLSGALSLMMAQATVLLFGYATHLWIGNALGAAAYGIYGVVLSIQTIFGMILTLGVPVAISRFTARNQEHAQNILKRGLKIQLIAALSISAFILLTSPLLSRLLGDTTLTPLISFVALVIFTQAFYPMYVQFFSGLHRFNRQAVLTVIYATVKLIGALSLIYFIGVYGAFAGFAIGGLAAAAVGWYWSKGQGGTKPLRLPIKSFLAFASLYVLTLAGLQLLISLDLFMVKALLADNTQAGYYNAAVTLSRIPYMLLMALGFVLLPSVSQLTKPGAAHHQAAVFIRDTIRYLIMLIVPSVTLAAATSKPLLRLFFFSDQYIEAAPALTILMIGLGSLSFYLLLTNIVSGAGRPKLALYTTFGMLLISGLLGTILIPRLGLIGAAWQTTIAALIGLTILSVYTFRTFKIPLPFKSTINILIATAIAVAPTYLLEPTRLTLFPIYLLALVLFITVLLLLKEISAADRQRLASLHPRLSFVAPPAN